MAPWVSSGHSDNAMFAGGEDLLHRDRDEPREPAAAVLGFERHAPPARLDVSLVRVRPTRRRRDRAGARVERRAGRVTASIERREHVGDEAPELVEQAVHGLGIGMGERGSFDSAARSTRFSSAKRMSLSGATYSATDARLRPPGAGDVDAGPLEPARSKLACLLGIEPPAREDVQRAAVVVAEHARDARAGRRSRRCRRPRRPRARAGTRVFRATRPRRSPRRRGRCRRGTVPRRRARPTPAGRRSAPSAPIVNAVSRPPNDSPTISVVPSGVITIPFGKRHVVGRDAMRSVRVDRQEHRVRRVSPPPWRSNPKEPMYAVPDAPRPCR